MNEPQEYKFFPKTLAYLELMTPLFESLRRAFRYRDCRMRDGLRCVARILSSRKSEGT